MSAFNAWVLLKSLETLTMRVERMSSSALQIAEALEKHPKVSSVRYPFLKSHKDYDLAKRQMSGGGSTVAMTFDATSEQTFKFMNALQVIDISNNLGDSKSLATHPATTTHKRVGPEVRAKAGITDGTVRISVGLENVDDLLKDLQQALAKAF
jgi:O-succinylhomoserine sulfhydrylase